MAPDRPPVVSFLVPVRDGEATLGEALRSISAQTVRDWEAVVVDDGSTDRTSAVARAAAQQDPRIRVVSRPAEGLVAALNAGLSHCRGRYVARMDADDRALPERLARQLPLLDGDPQLAAVDGRVRFFRDDGPVPQGMRLYEAWVNAVITTEDFDRQLLIESPVVHPAATLRFDAIRQVGGYRHGDFPEDYELWLRLHATGWDLRKVPEVLVEMRDRPRRLTRVDPRYNRQAFRTARQFWLSATVLSTPRTVVLWGGGKECGAWLRWLRSEGHRVVAVVDIDPRKVGGVRQGEVPVVAPQALPDLEVEVALVSVRARGARALIREALRGLRPGWREGRHWWAVS